MAKVSQPPKPASGSRSSSPSSPTRSAAPSRSGPATAPPPATADRVSLSGTEGRSQGEGRSPNPALAIESSWKSSLATSEAGSPASPAAPQVARNGDRPTGYIESVTSARGGHTDVLQREPDRNGFIHTRDGQEQGRWDYVEETEAGFTAVRGAGLPHEERLTYGHDGTSARTSRGFEQTRDAQDRLTGVSRWGQEHRLGYDETGQLSSVTAAPQGFEGQDAAAMRFSRGADGAWQVDLGQDRTFPAQVTLEGDRLSLAFGDPSPSLGMREQSPGYGFERTVSLADGTFSESRIDESRAADHSSTERLQRTHELRTNGCTLDTSVRDYQRHSLGETIRGQERSQTETTGRGAGAVAVTNTHDTRSVDTSQARTESTTRTRSVRERGRSTETHREVETDTWRLGLREGLYPDPARAAREGQPPTESTQTGVQVPVPPMDLEHLRQIGSIEDPVERNRRITESYHDLSNRMAQVMGSDEANWATWATWASRQAGQTIRREDGGALADGLTMGLDALNPAGAAVGSFSGIELNPLRRLSESASDAVATGNQRVYQEIGQEFGRFINTFGKVTHPDPQLLAHYQEGFTPEQAHLREAFTNYYHAKFETDADQKSELILLGNCLIGQHEQTRLQPDIERALPSLGREAATSWMMQLGLPQETLSLGSDVPQHGGRDYPPTLTDIDNPRLREVLAQYGGFSLQGSGATDWAQLDDRMGFIVNLFRSRQTEPSLFNAP